MYKTKHIFLLLMLPMIALAGGGEIVTCPDINEIKAGNFQGWLPLYKHNEELAFDSDVKKFQQNVLKFEEARWSSDYQEMGHCFYIGADPIVYAITFAKQLAKPQENSSWVWMKPARLALCWVSQAECGFLS